MEWVVGILTAIIVGPLCFALGCALAHNSTADYVDAAKGWAKAAGYCKGHKRGFAEGRAAERKAQALDRIERCDAE